MTFSIEREHAAQLYDVYERALGVLSEAAPTIFGALKGEARKTYIDAHTKIIDDIRQKLCAPLVIRYGDLVPEKTPDTQLYPEEQEVVDQLTAAQIQRIDDALLAECARRASKVARIVGTAWIQLRDEIPDVPDAFYAQRVKFIVNSGKLESRGNLDHIRSSEVRLARDPLEEVVDAPINVNANVLDSLTAFRDGRKRTDMAEAEPGDPSVDLSPNLDRLANGLLHGIAANPSKRWVMAQFQQSLASVVRIDKEGRERFGSELKNLMQVLGIESDDGLLDFYLRWF